MKRRLWRQRHDDVNHRAYKAASLKCKNAIERFHAKQESKLLSSDRRSFFRYLNKKLKSHSDIPDMRDSNGNIFTSNIDKASGFAEEFQSTFTRDDGELPLLQKYHILHPLISDLDFSPRSILKHLSQINSSAADPDGLLGIFL